MKGRGEQFWRATIFSLLGPLVWTLHFGLVYGLQHVACSDPVAIHPALIRMSVVLITVFFAIPLLFAIIKPQKVSHAFNLKNLQADNLKFLSGTMRLLCLLSLFGVFWAGAAAIFLHPCPVMR